jgi:hypothetical protein
MMLTNKLALGGLIVAGTFFVLTGLAIASGVFAPAAEPLMAFIAASA